MIISRRAAAEEIRLSRPIYALVQGLYIQVGAINKNGVWGRNSRTMIPWCEVEALHDYSAVFNLK